MTNEIKTVSSPLGGGEEYNPLADYRDFETLLGNNPSQAVLDMMARMNANKDEIADIKRSMGTVGIHLDQIHMPVLQFMVAQLILEKQRYTLLRAAHTDSIELIDKIGSALEAKTSPIVTKATSTMSQLNALVAQFDPKGRLAQDLATELASSARNAVSGLSDELEGKLEDVLARNECAYRESNDGLRKLLADQAAEIEKFRTINVTQIVANIMSNARDKFNELSQSASKQIAATKDQAVARMKESSNAAVTAAATAKDEAVNALAKKSKTERLLNIGSMATVSVVLSVISNVVLFKLIWPHI